MKQKDILIALGVVAAGVVVYSVYKNKKATSTGNFLNATGVPSLPKAPCQTVEQCHQTIAYLRELAQSNWKAYMCCKYPNGEQMRGCNGANKWDYCADKCVPLGSMQMQQG